MCECAEITIIIIVQKPRLVDQKCDPAVRNPELEKQRLCLLFVLRNSLRLTFDKLSVGK
jgi:hypothetical protein